MVQATPTATLENLSRLASKPGVQSTLILSKSDGSIIRSTGLLVAPPLPSSKDLVSDDDTNTGGGGEPTEGMGSNGEYVSNTELGTTTHSAEHVARMVFAFVAGAEEFTKGMDKSDEVKLLRLRTRKNELVILPDPRFIIVVIHDAPLA